MGLSGTLNEKYKTSEALPPLNTHTHTDSHTGGLDPFCWVVGLWEWSCFENPGKLVGRLCPTSITKYTHSTHYIDSELLMYPHKCSSLAPGDDDKTLGGVTCFPKRGKRKKKKPTEFVLVADLSAQVSYLFLPPFF